MRPGTRDPDTAVVLPVLALQAALDRVAARRPDAVRPGIPPHISVAYPFLPVPELDGRVRARLRELVAAAAPSRTVLTAPVSSPGILYAAPRPPDLPDRLAEDLRAEWPSLRAEERAGGKADVGAHLTLALGADEDHEELARSLGDLLPRSVVLDEVWLLVRAAGAWRLEETLRLR